MDQHSNQNNHGLTDSDVDLIVARVLGNIEKTLRGNTGPVAIPPHVAALMATQQGTLVSKTQLGANAPGVGSTARGSAVGAPEGAASTNAIGGTSASILGNFANANMSPIGNPATSDGVFTSMEAAIAATFGAQKIYAKAASVKDRQRIIDAIRKAALDNKETLALLMFEESKLGRYPDKISKIELAATKTPGMEDLTTQAQSGDNGLTIEEMAPFGVIGAITPVTNPVETIISNGISMLAAGNGVVFNVHPSSKSSSAFALRLFHKAIVAAGAPENLISMVANPSLETVKILSESPKVAMLVGTGGPQLVKSLLMSGKKAIGAGAGNPPVIVDETADLALAAKAIVLGASFDNNLLCIAEKSVFVLNSIYNDLMYAFLKEPVYVLNHEELKKVMALTLVADITSDSKGASGSQVTESGPGVGQGFSRPVGKSCSFDGPTSKSYHVAKEWIGQDASAILAAIGIDKPSVRLLLCEVASDHPYVILEQMMPILPIVRVATFDEAVDLAVITEKGNRHTASIFSRNIDHMTQFARAVDTTIFVKNATTMAGVGFGGEGSATFTIAGPTGEGITSARTFTRVRRCVLAEGGFRIV